MEHAQCVLGNHELNILRHADGCESPKEGNRWIFFRTLPLALERDDLRVVHACWDDRHIETLRAVRDESVTDASERWAQEQTERMARAPWYAQATEEEASLREIVADPDARPPMLSALAKRRVMEQNDHPVKVFTSGKEEVADRPFFAGGRWRFERRSTWWDHYEHGPMVVVGHYWRPHDSQSFEHKGPSIFEGTDPRAPLGKGHVMCVDYAVGYRAHERALGLEQNAFLAAYRWPEQQLVFSDHPQ